jgi:hypothetical protein
MTTMTIDRTTRDVMRENLSCYVDLEQLDGAIRSGGSDVLELRTKALLLFGLLDEIGWLAEDPRERFDITIDPADLVAWMRPLLADLTIDVPREERNLAAQQAGDEEYYYYESSQDESIEITRRELERLRAEQEAVSQLLDQLEAVA